MFTSHFHQRTQQHLVPRSVNTAFSNSRLIELALLNEWIWSYKPLNWVRMDPNKKYVSPQPRSAGLRCCLHWRYTDEASKIGNSFINGCNTHFSKPLIFFMCSHFKISQRVIIKGWSCFSQDQKDRNKLLGLQV